MKKRKNARTTKGKARLRYNHKNIQIVKSKPPKSEAEILRERNKMLMLSPEFIDVFANSQEQISVPWKNVFFKDGYIEIKYQGYFFQKYIQQCKRYLNDIKAHYLFKNVPEIQAVIKGREVIKFLNEEVLFYHIDFLSDTGTLFDSSYQKLTINKWSRYTKTYYRKCLAFAFQPHCLDKLCELSDSDLP